MKHVRWEVDLESAGNGDVDILVSDMGKEHESGDIV
jgi:hypothetical protein